MLSLSDKSAAVLELAKRGVVRARDLEALGVPRAYLGRLVARGLLEHVDRGLYRHRKAKVTEHHGLAEVMKRVPHGVVCLMSALQLHGLTSEAPHAVWVLIENRARLPRVASPKVEVVRASGQAFFHGVEERTLDGVALKVTTPAKTVADCFRYRRHVGLAVALEALRDYLGHTQKRRGSEFTVNALMRAAMADRIATVMRPYVEALT